MKLSIFYSLVFSFLNLANAEKVLNQEEEQYNDVKLMEASNEGDLEAVKALIEAGGAVNAKDKYGWMAFDGGFNKRTF